MGNEDAARVKKNDIRSTVVGSKEVRRELEKRTLTRTRTSWSSTIGVRKDKDFSGGGGIQG